MAGVLYYRETSNEIIDTPVDTDIVWGTGEVFEVQENSLSLEDALEMDMHIYNSYHFVDNTEDMKAYDDFYSKFIALQSYEDYKAFSEKYPELLFVIYAAKNRDKENYLKFYNFIFSKVLEENIPQYISDLKEIWGSELEWEELRQPFMDTIESQYDIISTWTNPFSLNLWHGPIHIALTADSLEEAKQHCDEWDISWVDELSRQECYNYVLHYRATDENNYCDQLFGEYDIAICKSYLQSIAQ